MRPAVEQLKKSGYPVKAIDIDQEPELQQRYHVKSVPTFIVIDSGGREIDRTSGAQPAAELARFYKTAAAKARPKPSARTQVAPEPESDDGADDPQAPRARETEKRDGDQEGDEEEREGAAPATNPKPWEAVVRIRVLNNRSIGFGSGTIIHSTPEESLILTCAHIFKLEGRNKQVPPAQFPKRIEIDLFDGNLQGTRPATVHFLEAVKGEAVDYDFTRDVGLIRIRPGRRLPACRVVPNHWEPQARMQVLTVGCSEGHDATAWQTTISKARIQNFLAGNPAYEAIECHEAPKQGRSGGGLFTDDGYVAGVCNFAEPMGNHGLYATPRSIYSILDRNNLMALYAPVSRGSGTLVADNRGAAKRNRSEGVAVARSQSPDHDDSDRPAAAADGDDLQVPHPSLLGITEPITKTASGSTRVANGATRRTAWQPHPVAAPAPSPRRRAAEETEQTDLNLDPAADPNHFGASPSEPHSGTAGADEESDAPARPKATVTNSPGSRWKAVKADPATAAAGQN
jgi:hypothetical protein